jgi:hypothetical protein
VEFYQVQSSRNACKLCDVDNVLAFECLAPISISLSLSLSLAGDSCGLLH